MGGRAEPHALTLQWLLLDLRLVVVVVVRMVLQRRLLSSYHSIIKSLDDVPAIFNPHN
jgi:hypothetical protein